MPAQSRSALRRLIGAAVLAAASVVGCTQLDAWQRQRIFAPEPQPQTWWREPAAGTEVFDLDVGGGERVRAWYWQSPLADAPTVLYLHGARWNLNGAAFRIEGWTRMGYSVLAIDYRGFGASTPRLPSEATAQQDAVAGLRELARRQPDPSRRFIYGHSLGGAIAIDLASRPNQPPFAGLIVESSFTSIGAMLATMKWGKLPGAGLLITQPFDSIEKVALMRTPMLFMHGTADRVVPHTMSDQLYEAAHNVTPGLKRLVKIEGASHSGAFRSGAQYETAVGAFMRDASRAYGRKQG
ncbi:alpha/beta hydrolase [Achromobacter sp. AONIH1]|uniref:alpha/beta hydrolase n=1 Tax=Achromobacter sp. AONIH1 TaxID=1758194 RepID=UPI000CD29F43|nr:alpha/beta fold hydrolase [Achromobacter sp. AONIH1]AUT46006.1 alpha/beta hydrolase [Achromobacter sp. AONIH1]